MANTNSAKLSLKLRLIISALVILTAFITLTGITLDRAYYSSSMKAVEEYINSQVFVLMAAAEPEANGDISMSSSLLETKFSLPSSGLYAYIMNNDKVVWKSLSTIGISTPDPVSLLQNEKQLEHIEVNHQEKFLTYAHGVLWKVGKASHHLTFNIQLDLDTFSTQVATFRQNLWGWLIGMASLLLVSLSLLLYWGLLPLRRVAREIKAVESGAQQNLGSDYPQEINILTENINKFIEHEHQRQSRYKNALGDLAHSLKTPLAVIRSQLDKNKVHLDAETAAQLDEQVSNINNIIQYQLQRAATVGQQQLVASIQIKPLLDKILNVLDKVHADKALNSSNLIDENLTIKMNTDDAMEVFGNLLENAYKWARSEIVCRANISKQHIELVIEDDGKGILPEQRQEILKRGVRMDSQTPGHGIGLAIVQDILSAYGYSLDIATSVKNGARFSVVIKGQA